MSNVFIIVNEFYPDDEVEYPCVEIVGGVAYGSLDQAREALALSAAEDGVELNPYTGTDYYASDNDYYYIQELIKHG